MNNFQQTYGNLKDSLAQRRISGSSFANSDQERAQLDLQQQLADADAQSYLDELNATTSLVQQRTAVRTDTITKALAQSNFETEVGANLTGMVLQAMQGSNALIADLAKTGAAISANAASTRGNLVSNVNQPLLSSFPQYAQIAAQGQEGQGSLLGYLGSQALFGTGGSSGGSSGFGGLLSGAGSLISKALPALALA